MLRFLRLLGLSLLLLSSSVLSADEPVASSPASPETDELKIVVLRNSRTLRGRVEEVNRRYRVALEYGEVLLRQDEVIGVCSNFEEAYEALRQSGDEHSAEHHLRLALWCIDRSLENQAETELARAVELQPNDPRIAYVQRRLSMSQKLKSVTSEAKPVSHSEKKIVTIEELDRLMRNLPHGTPETFSHVIQPILVSRCATSGCHAVSSNQALRLLRPPVSRGQAARITQRNLHSVLQFVDGENPENSKLILAAKLPHGGMPQPIFGAQDHAQMRQLIDWIAQTTRAETPASSKPATVMTLKPPPWSDQQLNQMRPPAGFFEAGAGQREKLDPLPMDAFDKAMSQSDRKALNFPAPPKSADNPQDPFDPAIFNSRYSNKPQ